MMKKIVEKIVLYIEKKTGTIVSEKIIYLALLTLPLIFVLFILLASAPSTEVFDGERFDEIDLPTF